MTFAEREESRYSGEPVDLFLFRYGTATGAYFAYTDAEESITYGGVEYFPLSIQRGNINASGSLDKSALRLDCPINAGISDLFRVYPPSQPVTLIIRQGHVGDAEFPTIWSGRVIQCQRDGSEAQLTCESIVTSMRRTGLRRNYQLSCPHALYGVKCGASKASATIYRAVINIPSGSRVTLADGWSGAIASAKYVGGIVEWSGANGTETRTILRVITDKVLALSGPVTGLTPGAMISVVLGCNHQMGVGPQPNGDCLPLHNNIHNFGGDGWIPTENPINTNPFN